ncbi:MAG: gliding motility-associated ABC transporter substrate-binding protein GldG, partial [Cyclobacteriaceae bacterium]|nr:gliding motility-associated ABC transporter substrate-binding protein GldG [Cyclobacteriaceae bacterium HetDA_MAG_MS6]
MVSQSDHKLSYVLQFLIVALTVLLINQISSKYRVWWDLTEEKRYTISESSKETLDDLEETLTIEVYLTGELPSNFKRFQNAIEDLLERFAYYGGSNIQYRFVDPNQAGSARSRNEFYRSLVEKGLQQTNLTYTKDGQKSEKVVFPGAVLSYQEKEVGIQLLKGNRAGAIEEMLNQSIEGLEYELISGIHSIIDDSRKRIGFVMGHNEPDTSQLAGFTNVVLSKYDLYRIDLPNRSTPLLGYDAIIVGKPSTAFSTREKYLLDQYVTSGGSLMLMIDVMSVDLKDAEGEGTVPKSNDLKLEDLLFNWGVRINQDYVVDLSCGDYPVVAGMVGNQPRIQLLPWPYFPVITNYGDHPMVRHLDAMRLRFTSTIDTVKAPGVRKTPLFLTSNYTKVMTPPFQVSFDDLREELRPEFFTSGVKSTAYLLEGQFRSLFRN